MEKFILPLLLVILFVSCKPDYGTVDGNVFWKYNNYVGNKPDAGSRVELYPYKANAKPIETQADVQGNFKFDKVEVGDYVLIVKSKNTTSSPNEYYSTLIHSREYLQKLFNLDITTVAPEKQKEFDKLNNQYMALITQDVDYNSSDALSKKIDAEDKISDSLKHVATAIVDALPMDFQSKFQFSALPNKIEFKLIKVENEKSATAVIDFGTTYY